MAQPYAEPCSRGVIEAAPYGGAREVSPLQKRMVLAACVLASSMAFIDGSVLTVALPALRVSFAADYAALQWILNGYVLALAALTLIGGALADVHGKARVLAVGCVLFALASAACALAPSAGWLIAARVAQGVAAALVTPASLALIGATYPVNERSRAIGIWAAASALTTAGGPVLGGWLIELFGWRSIFWLNPPIAVAAIALLLLFAPPDRREPQRFDLVGAAILAAALGALAFALSQLGSGETVARPYLQITAAAITGVAGLALYAGWERVARHPMTPPRLARNRPFVGLNIATLAIYAGLSVMFFLLPFELSGPRNLTPAEIGLVFLPFTLPLGFLSSYFGKLADAFGARIPIAIGATGAALAYAWLALGHSLSLIAGVILPMLLLGISFAVLVAPLTAAVMSSVSDADEGLASGINNAASRVAQLAGVAGAASLAAFASGYTFGLVAAAALSFAGALVAFATVPPGRAHSA